jgi:HD-GYP domain-containing protein (c-di-GMP phosphodiesterase class II)
MAIHNNILEKPDRLTNDEFTTMKNHAVYTHQILSNIQGFEDICEWASYHHEKLNGKGYPYGKTAKDLSTLDRLLSVLDIYQALSEDRPYKKGMPIEKITTIMQEMVDRFEIDEKITHDVLNYSFQK